jgi:hypothetical protein
MKFLTLLASFYMLALSCVPCICEDNCANEKTEQSKPADKRQEDNCTPFCSCSCCHSVVFNLKPILSAKKLSEFQAKATFELADENFTSYNSHNIWQPPKLS